MKKSRLIIALLAVTTLVITGFATANKANNDCCSADSACCSASNACCAK